MKRSRFLYLTVAIIITIITFTNSLMPGDISSGQSGFFVNLLKDFLIFLKIPFNDSDLPLIIRKGAHFSQFFFLGLFYYLYYNLTNREPYEPYLLTLNIGLLIAMTDEFIQYFVPGRAMMLTDILIDLSGVTTVLIIILIITSLKRKGATK